MIALIDADVVAYQACGARGAEMMVDPSGAVVPRPFTKEEDAAYLRKSLDSFRSRLNEVAEAAWADDYLAAVKGPGNYRDLLYPEYKANRHKDSKLSNHFVPLVRRLAAMEGLVVEAEGREADDMLRIWANQCTQAGKDFVVCSIDKDLRCIPGKHLIIDLWNPCLIEVSEHEAKKLYYEQLLKGDPTDNIPGIPRVGDVKAAKMLAGCKTDEEFQEIVVAQYISYYGNDWLSWFLSNAKMIHLQRHPDDYFNCREWPIIRELEGF